MDIPCTYIPDGMFKMPVRLLVGRKRCTLHSLAIYDRRGILSKHDGSASISNGVDIYHWLGENSRNVVNSSSDVWSGTC